LRWEGELTTVNMVIEKKKTKNKNKKKPTKNCRVWKKIKKERVETLDKKKTKKTKNRQYSTRIFGS
jgi:hypothetical protein